MALWRSSNLRLAPYTFGLCQGKSLSLICGTLSWLHKSREKGELIILPKTDNQVPDDSDEPAWVVEFEKKKKKEERKLLIEFAEKKRLELEEDLLGIRQLKSRLLLEGHAKKVRTQYRKGQKTAENEDDFLLEDYKENQETERILREIELERRALEKEREPQVKETKIFYTSRTHSQIAQFIKEISKTKYADKIKITSLGSRKQLCINDTVKASGSVQDMNDMCLDMQKGTIKEKCPYLSKEGDKLDDLALNILVFYTPLIKSDVHDIEDIAKIGEVKGICPYYGTRNAIEKAEIVTLPYNLLFSKSSREALGIDLADHVIIIDEAHNIVESISELHSATLSLHHIQTAEKHLNAYLSKYEKRLSRLNLMHLKQVILLLTRFREHLQCTDKKTVTSSSILTELDIDNINIFKLQTYLKESKLSQKVLKMSETQLNGFVDKVNQVTSGEVPKREYVTIQSVESFLACLTNADIDGRIIFDTDANNMPFMKFMLINPAAVFEEVTSVARAVVLAGGTIEPVLFSDLIGSWMISGDSSCQTYYPSDSKVSVAAYVSLFSLTEQHIVPKENILVLACSQGPKMNLSFTFEKRDDPNLASELGNIIANFANLIPKGLILFFPSYAYLEKIFRIWKETGILARIEKRKDVFMEPKETNAVDEVLRKYGDSIKNPREKAKNGALIMCVVGGKLSEGINFSDDLGRGVVMVGLPFANMYAPEIQEKMRYYKEKFKDAVFYFYFSHEKNAGNEFYENLCMKAVNQSIGGLFQLIV